MHDFVLKKSNVFNLYEYISREKEKVEDFQENRLGELIFTY